MKNPLKHVRSVFLTTAAVGAVMAATVQAEAQHLTGGGFDTNHVSVDLSVLDNGGASPDASGGVPVYRGGHKLLMPGTAAPRSSFHPPANLGSGTAVQTAQPKLRKPKAGAPMVSTFTPPPSTARPAPTPSLAQPPKPFAAPQPPALTAPAPALAAPAPPAMAPAPAPTPVKEPVKLAKPAPAAPKMAAKAPPPPPRQAAKSPKAPPPPPKIARVEPPKPTKAVPAPSAPPAKASLPAGGATEGRAVQVPYQGDATRLPGSSREPLKALANQLKGQEGMRLQLMAYAGGENLSPSKARRLSLSRALAVRSFLIENGVRSTRIDVRALGNKTTEQPVNRVDINIVER